MPDEFLIRYAALDEITRIKRELSDTEAKELFKKDTLTAYEQEDIIFFLEALNEEGLRAFQYSLYENQQELYKKFDPENRGKLKNFFTDPQKRIGLFAIYDINRDIVKLQYRPGKDLAEVNEEGDLIKYHKYEEGSQAAFWGDILKLNTSLMDALIQNAGYEWDAEAGMNMPSKKEGVRALLEFDKYGNTLENNIEIPPGGYRYAVYKRNPLLYVKLHDRITGYGGNIVELDNGAGKVLINVPYYHQSDNATKDGTGDGKVYGGNMCQLTALAMALGAKGVTPADPGKQLEDELYEIAKDAGMGRAALWNITYFVYETVVKAKNANLF